MPTYSTLFFLLILRPPRATLFPTRRSSDLHGSHMRGQAEIIHDVEQIHIAVERRPRRERHEGGDQRQPRCPALARRRLDRKSTRLNSSHSQISYAVFCLKKKIARQRACTER